VVQQVLERMEGASVDVFVVWIPAIPGDHYEAAEASMALVPDRRARHYWDGSQSLGEAFSPALGIRSRMAWDVFVIFDDSARWDGGPPPPRSWLHQITGEDRARELSEGRLEDSLRELVN
jgi:hypothetical protein